MTASRSLRAWPRALALALLGGLALSSIGSAGAPAELSERHRAWLEEVEILITEAERETFLTLEEDYQRELFIEEFWRLRDPEPTTHANLFREEWERRVRDVRERYGNLREDRARALLLVGPPVQTLETECVWALWPLEIWFYEEVWTDDRMRRREAATRRGGEPRDPLASRPQPLALVFFKGGGVGKPILWNPEEGLTPLVQPQRLDGRAEPCPRLDLQLGRDRARLPQGRTWRILEAIYCDCPQEMGILLAIFTHMGHSDAEVVEFARAIGRREHLWAVDPLSDLARARRELPHPEADWTPGFLDALATTDAGAGPLDAALAVAYPGRERERTVLEGLVRIASGSTRPEAVGERSYYRFELAGELLRERRLFERFRYRFDLPLEEADPSPEDLALVFHRRLLPGEYDLVLRVRDLNTGRVFLEERDLLVPEVRRAFVPRPPESEDLRVLEAALEAAELGQPVTILSPSDDEVLAGYVRVHVEADEERVAGVRFELDDHPVMVRRRPPFTVEVDLGDVPRPRTLRAVGIDSQGREVGRAELAINPGRQRFAVRLVEPVAQARDADRVEVAVDVRVPEGEELDRVELYLDEELVATRQESPFTVEVEVPDREISYLRAVAYLPDGSSAEAARFLRAPDVIDTLDVRLVEMHFAVTDRDGRPVDGLARDQVRLIENGAPREILRFEPVEDLPLHLGIMLDVSGSMEGRLGEARRAVAGLLEADLTPKDRMSLVTFHHFPDLGVDFTNDWDEVGRALLDLEAAGGTALWDALVFTLYHFEGLQGQRAVILLSDGEDVTSRAEFDTALEFARRSGVAVYTVGLDIGRFDRAARRQLRRLAEETGGRSYFVDEAEELAEAYGKILRELRSRYLVAFQSSGEGEDADFRTVDLEVDLRGARVAGPRGYYP